MASVAAPSAFKKVLPFGQYEISLDTASSFYIMPTISRGKQAYQVHIRVDTPDGTSNTGRVGWGYFKIDTDSLEKAEKVIERLVACNVKWHGEVVQKEFDLKNRTIDLFYPPDTECPYSLREMPTKAGNRLNCGNLMMMFKKALDLESPDYNIDCVSPPEPTSFCLPPQIGEERIRITFKNTPDVQEKMAALAEKLDGRIHRSYDFPKGKSIRPYENSPYASRFGYAVTEKGIEKDKAWQPLLDAENCEDLALRHIRRRAELI